LIWLDILIRGGLIGAIYSLIAIGLNLEYGVTRILNIAHGEFLMVGAYISWYVYTYFGVNPLVSLLISGPTVAGLGVLVQLLVFRRLVRQSATAEELEFRSLLGCFGLMFIIQNVVSSIYRFEGWPPQVSTSYLYDIIDILGERIQLNMIAAAILSIVVGVLLYIMLRFTRLGLAMRATVEEPTGAKLVGINILTIHAVSFGLGCLLSALAGSMLVMRYAVDPFFGPPYTFVALAVIILGGMGSFTGSLLGGFLIGYAYYASNFVEPVLATAVVYVFIIIVLLIRPKGLFGR
jgi:branched-chain amino acid transport system permease protein